MNQFDFQRGVMASDLEGSSKWILVVIGSHVNWKTGQAAFPSIDTLVKESGFSKATIHRAKKLLVSQGYLVSQRHFNKSNTYLVMIPPSLTVIPPSLIETLEWSHDEELKENITDNIKDNRKDNNKSSNEDLVLDSNISLSKESIEIEEYNQSDNPSLAEVKAMAAEDIWAVFESR